MLLVVSTTANTQGRDISDQSTGYDEKYSVVSLLDREYCVPEQVDLRASLDDLFYGLAKSDPDKALIKHFQVLRCLSARNFHRAYNLLFEHSHLDTRSPRVASVVFLYLDMGGRLLDDRAQQWLKRFSRQRNASDAVAELEFYAVSGASLVKVPRFFHAGLLTSFDVSTWQGAHCSLTDMVFDKTGQPHCPEDFCPLVRDVLDLEALLPNKELLAQLCRAANKTEIGEIDASIRDAAQRCIDEFVADRSESELTCIVRSRKRPFDLDNLGFVPVPATVIVSDSCKISTTDDGRPTELEILEGRQASLKQERDDLDDANAQLWNDYNEAVKRRREAEADKTTAEVAEAAARQEADRLNAKKQGRGSLSAEEEFRLATAEAEAEAARYAKDEATAKENIEEDNKRDIVGEVGDNQTRQREIDEELEELEEEIKAAGGTIQCAPDDYGCSDSCTVVDEQLAAAFECTRGQITDQEPGAGGVDETADDPLSPDPEVTDPPDEDAPISPEYDQLTQCLSAAMGGSENACATNLRCMDGEQPTVNEFGLCTCPSAPTTGPDQTPCEWLIECPVDHVEPCQCRSEEGGVSPAPPTNRGGLITIRP
jgi:hypothetical protein